MATKYAAHVNPKQTPQSEPIPAREDEMVKNSAGGFVFQVGDWMQAKRFLVLGAEGGTYYATEKELTVNNAKALLRCIKSDACKLVDLVVEISDGGKSYRNDACLFALALVFTHGDKDARAYAAKHLDKVVRIGTHMLTFVSYVDTMRGWGRGLREAVGKWYTDKPADKLAYQMIKYRQRGGWSHRDVLRLTHPHPENAIQNTLFSFATYLARKEQPVVEGKKPRKVKDTAKKAKEPRASWTTHKAVNEDHKKVIEYLTAAERLRTDATLPVPEAIELIREHNMPRETLRTELLNDLGVWEVLMEHMPLTAMIRNLGKMSSIGLLAPLSKTSKQVINALGNTEAMKKARVHPLQILAALNTYKQGHGMKGSLTWPVVPQVVDALDEAFYKSFDFVEPSGQNIMLSLDVSGSMAGAMLAGIPGMSARDCSAALAMVTARTEKNWVINGFTCGTAGRYGGRWDGAENGLTKLNISPRQRLDDVIRTVSGLSFGGTDCSLPMLQASKDKMHIDLFVIYTDNETWAGKIHPSQALNQYRKAFNPNAKLVVVGMTATGFTIADPNDTGMMDVVGFSTDTPKIITEFAKGNL